MDIQQLFSVEGKIALVTGGSRGIGEMIAGGFLANGAKVYISSRKADACTATAERLMQRFGGECVPLPADLSGLDGATALAGELREREDRLDVLVNNAGQAWGAPFEEFPEKGWDRVMDINVKGPVLPDPAAASRCWRLRRRPTAPVADHQRGLDRRASVRRSSRRSPTARRRRRSTP